MDPNEEYRSILTRCTELRRHAQDRGIREVGMFATSSFLSEVRRYNRQLDDELVVFAANDFGIPVAVRSSAVPLDAQNDVRERILTEKYRVSRPLNEIREALLLEYPRVHKVLVATCGDEVDYHLPEPSSPLTNFQSVRDALGLVDWTTNGVDRNCRTYD